MPSNVLAYLAATAAQTPVTDTNRVVRLTVPQGDRYVVSFADSLTQEAIWTIPALPDAYQGGILTLVVQCVMATATTGTINLGVQVEALNPTHPVNLETTSEFATINSLNLIAVPNSSGRIFTASVNLTHIDGAQAGDMVRLKLMRVAPDGATGAMYVIGAALEENVSTLNIANFNFVSSSNLAVGPTSGVQNATVTVGKNGQTGNRTSAVILYADDINNYGLQLLRLSGQNGNGYVAQRGGGSLNLVAIDGGDVILQSGSEPVILHSDGRLNMPAIASPINPQKGDRWHDSTQNAQMFNQGVTLSTVGCVATTTSPVALGIGQVNLSTLATNTKGSFTLPANFFTTGKTCRLTIYYSANVPGASYSINVYLGSPGPGINYLGGITSSLGGVFAYQGMFTYSPGGATGVQFLGSHSVSSQSNSGNNPQLWPMTSNFNSSPALFDVQFTVGGSSGSTMTLGNICLEILN